MTARSEARTERHRLRATADRGTSALLTMAVVGAAALATGLLLAAAAGIVTASARAAVVADLAALAAADTSPLAADDGDPEAAARAVAAANGAVLDDLDLDGWPVAVSARVRLPVSGMPSWWPAIAGNGAAALRPPPAVGRDP